MPNRLANSTSPYLLQHKDNPVDWYPWGEEALNKAVAEDKPIFLSIGYSACHWCHVMEHESFENEAIAKMLNENFVSIKVDREQRPDLDQIYMKVAQWMTGSGGWPLNVFLTPQTEPFYAGTYWPPAEAYQRPGFPSVLSAVSNAWKEKRDQVTNQANQIVASIKQSDREATKADLSHPFQIETAVATLQKCDQTLHELFDDQYGGFGSTPKFPHATNLQLLLRLQAVDPQLSRERIIQYSLDRMAQGGIYDQLGGGFARYSVDQYWLVPHFEKMLYDNALLADIYLDAYRYWDDLEYATVVRQTLDYILRDMTDASGGFYSAEDADSEGEEGKFYVWSLQEVQDVLEPEEAKFFCHVFSVTQGGNFEGHNILYRQQPLPRLAAELGVSESDLRTSLDRSRRKLLSIRENRVRPGLDDKVLVAWNALMIGPMCRAGLVLEEPRYLTAAKKCADFILKELVSSSGELLHVWRAGKAEIGGYLDDYAAFGNALLSLWETTQDQNYLAKAIEFASQITSRFAAPNGAYYFTASDAETLITRTIDLYDGSTPSGNSLTAELFIRLYHWTGNQEYRDQVERLFASFAQRLQDEPGVADQMMIAVDRWLHDVEHCTLHEAQTRKADETRRRHFQRYAPNSLFVAMSSSHPAFESLIHPVMIHPVDQFSTALFVCKNQTCLPPIVGDTAIETHFAKPSNEL